MNINPLRRSPIKKKGKQHKESAPWRNPKIRLSQQEWLNLRMYVLERSEHQCEADKNGARCKNRQFGLEVHHMEHRGRGGSDTKENCIAVCWECHDRHHKKHEIIVPHKDWQP